MPRNVTLASLVSDLRAEIGASTSVSQGVGSLPALEQVLRRTQERLYQDYNWPHLVSEYDEPLIAGQRYYTFDANVNFDRIISAHVKYSGDWREVRYGFDTTIYNLDDSEDGERNDPVQLYRHYDTNQFEVWPVPAGNDQTLRFRCIRNLRPLIANSDQCDLDSNLLVLFSAAELLQRLKSADAESKLAAASQFYRSIKGNLDKLPSFKMGGDIRVSGGFPSGDWQLWGKRV